MTFRDGIPRSAFKTRRTLVEALRSKLQDCHNDSCIMAQQWVQKHHNIYTKLSQALRPSMPSSWKANKYEWLSNFDILRVMAQYEKKHRSFAFLDAAPIDFASCMVSSALCEFNSAKLIAQGKTQMGVIFNLDPHYMPGSHWVACYANLNHKLPSYGVCYFDSNGLAPPSQIIDFMHGVKNTLPQEHNVEKFKIMYNNSRFQFHNSECGMFSMIFIILSLENVRKKQFHSVMSMIGDDANMNNLRNVLFTGGRRRS